MTRERSGVARRGGCVILALFTLSLAGCQAPVPVDANCGLSLAAELPFRVADGHILVDAKINEAPASLIFDTGAFTTILTEPAAKRLKLWTEDWAGGRAEGIGGSRQLSVVVAKTVDFGGMHGHYFHFATSDAGFAGRQANPDGTLSTDFLSKYDIDLDFPARKILLYSRTPHCGHPAVALTPPLFAVPLLPSGDDATPRIRVKIGGKSFLALIDTGAPVTAIFRDSASRLGLHIRALTGDRRETVGGVGPNRVAAIRHVFEPIEIGDLTVEHLPVAILDQSHGHDVEMLLGLDFQTRVHLWVSYGAHMLIMQVPPKPSPALP